MWDEVPRLVYGLLSDDGVPHRLEAEYRAWPARRRRQLVRKAVQRELMIRLSGQGRLRCEARAPSGVKRMLWWYSWTTVGDAVMDLSPRFLVPPRIEVELMITPDLAPLFEHDRRFSRVHTDWSSVSGPFDFLLVNHYGTDVLREKRKHLPDVSFASLYGHLAGEMFSRLHAADARVRQLFDLPPGAPSAPTIELPPGTACSDAGHTNLVVALGARDERRRYPHWNEALGEVLARWPADLAAPRFHLIGCDNGRVDRDAIDLEMRQRHCVDHLGRQSLLQAAQCIATADFFVGTDGGPMHLAIATGRSGVAMFGPVPPEYRLLPGAAVLPLSPGLSAGAVSPAALGQAVVDGVQRAMAHGRLRHPHHLHP